ncbi:unnamed protein product [Lactuca virosa]|uniref:Uncharacterized protein n=1 Tax=Lactuca virosa TaxID=75947 RepID=A0AAU9LWL7_9ASTR|nr:unnamed protein product [Lactuca virosa]
MVTIGEGSGSSNSNASSSASSHQAPKILLSKPALVTAAKYNRGPGGGGGDGGPDDASSSLHSCLPSVGFLNLLSNSWDFHTDRFLPFLTDNTDFTVIGVIGPPGVGKSTIVIEIYGFDATSPSSLAFIPFFI